MRKILLSSAGLVWACTSYAQVPVTEDIFTAIRSAQAKNVEIQNNQLELEKSGMEAKMVWNKYIPKVAVSGTYAYIDNEVTADIPTRTIPLIDHDIFAGKQQIDANANIAHAGITAKAVLFSGGQIYNGAKALEYKNRGTAMLMSLKEDEVARTILESFDQLAMIRKAERLIAESYKRLEQEQLRVTRAIENGLAIPYDRERIKLATLELDSKKKDLESGKQLIALKLEQETGISKEQILQLSHDTSPIIILERPDINERTELQALESFSKAADYKIKQEQGGYLPTLGAFAGYSYTSVFNGNAHVTVPELNNSTFDFKLNQFTVHPNFMAGIMLKWELFSGFETRYKVAEARISKTQVENKRSDATEQLNLQMKQYQLTYSSANDQLAIAKQRTLVAENNLNLADRQYQSGLISITDRLAAESQLYSEQLYLEETILNQRKAAMNIIQASSAFSTSLSIIK